ncbi:hydrogenase maturation nickel metallochaperone HypA [Geminocystis sp. NIES-3708]|uniref:hydrogenase maturation nickel metallochaperone HypA n=1 Tax=Geminocystis sp. NIES-3708 TaxID=1615909 RepID=UPI00083554F3|nr:hydrogenase maturation nickel metallochaperone HypA [Geminocystis sp. NIES-3708]
MHEIGIMEDTLNIAIDYAIKENATEIKEITICIGKMSGVVSEALKFAFEVIRKGTIAENSTLKIESLPVICYCDHCQQKFQPDEWFFQCPNCDQFSNNILQGKEIKLISLEVS